MDVDLEARDRQALLAEVGKRRAAMRGHSGATGHDLCRHRPALWGLLPEKGEPAIAVPPWPKFPRGCIGYRQSLDDEAADAPVLDRQ